MIAGRRTLLIVCGLFLLAGTTPVQAQTFGIELHNNLMPASGGMAGASLSRPQDLTSAINGNPATLRQFQGTQFTFGGAWADAQYNVTQAAPLPLLGVTPFSAKSEMPGALLGNIGVTQDLDVLGLPATAGLGLISNAGAGVDFRSVPESNGTSAQYLALDMVAGAGVELTEQFTVGAALTLATSYFDGPFVDVGGMTTAYGLRGSIGANYEFLPDTSVGAYLQSKKNFDFENAALVLGGRPVDVAFDHPVNVGFGLANSSLLDGRLLLAIDTVYKNYSDADTLKALYNDQWVVQLGGQYAVTDSLRVRLGYAFNENPMKDAQPVSIGGVTLPDGIPAVRYVEAQFAAITQHRITAGLGARDVLPGIDFDLFAGYAFENTDRFAGTTVEITDNYWIGFGTTWRFGQRERCDPTLVQ